MSRGLGCCGCGPSAGGEQTPLVQAQDFAAGANVPGYPGSPQPQALLPVQQPAAMSTPRRLLYIFGGALALAAVGGAALATADGGKPLQGLLGVSGALDAEGVSIFPSGDVHDPWVPRWVWLPTPNQWYGDSWLCFWKQRNSLGPDEALEDAKERCLDLPKQCHGVTCEGPKCRAEAGGERFSGVGFTSHRRSRVWPDGSANIVAPGVGTGPWVVANGRWSNWNGQYGCAPSAIYFPSSEAEVQQIVKDASAANKRVKVWGGGLSLSSAAQCDDGAVMMSLHNMNQTVKIENTDPNDLRITVQAGMRLRELYPTMDDAGLAFLHTGTVMAHTIAGALSTGTHGQHWEQPTMAGLVLALRMVKADGSVVVIDESTPDWRDAAACSFGALGIITQVTLRCVPRFYSNDLIYELPLFGDAVKDVRDFEDWKPELKIRYWRWDAGLGTSNWLWSRIHRSGAKDCDPAKKEPNCLVWWRQFTSTSNDLIYGWKVIEFELAVAREKAYLLLQEFRSFVEKNKGSLDPDRVQWFVVGRYVKGESAWMSPAHGRDSTFMTFYIQCVDSSQERELHCDKHMEENNACRKGKAIPCDDEMLQTQYDFFGREFERLAYSVAGARPHWGKDNNAHAGYLATVYPRFNDFVKLVKEWDPKGTFTNPYLRQRLLAV